MHLSLRSLTKRYAGGHLALTDFSTEIGPGILGLLGPNGAGKSTLMRILATISRPSSGSVCADGVDLVQYPDHVRRTLGYLPQEFGVYDNLSAVEFLRYLAALKGLDGGTARARIAALLAELNLTAVQNRAIATYSGGMRQRLGIAQALLNEPRLLILDEPTAGLDPQERVRFRNLLTHLAGESTVLLSSHIVSDVETIATEIVIMLAGRLIARGTPESLCATAADRVFSCQVAAEELAEVKRRQLVSRVAGADGGWTVRYLVPAGGTPEPGSTATPATLEDAYLLLTVPEG